MAASLHALVSVSIPNPTPRVKMESSLLSFYFVPCVASSTARTCAFTSGSKRLLLQSSLHGRLLRDCYVPLGKLGFPRMMTCSVHSEDSHSDVEINDVKDGIEPGQNQSEKAWEQVLQSFKQQALKMRSLSQEAYELYSKKAIEVLEETSKNMRIQADKASRDIAVIAQEISEEGREYISAASKNSPDSVKDVVEVFSAAPGEFDDVSKIHDFHLGIPYGALLAIGGFTSFMFTGSTSAIRFGVILGSILLALSISSLRTWKKGKTSSLLLKGQAAITTIIFVREWRLLFQRPSLLNSLMTIISGGVLVFYIYRIVVFRQNEGRSREHD